MNDAPLWLMLLLGATASAKGIAVLASKPCSCSQPSFRVMLTRGCGRWWDTWTLHLAQLRLVQVSGGVNPWVKALSSFTLENYTEDKHFKNTARYVNTKLTESMTRKSRKRKYSTERKHKLMLTLGTTGGWRSSLWRAVRRFQRIKPATKCAFTLLLLKLQRVKKWSFCSVFFFFFFLQSCSQQWQKTYIFLCVSNFQKRPPGGDI